MFSNGRANASASDASCEWCGAKCQGPLFWQTFADGGKLPGPLYKRFTSLIAQQPIDAIDDACEKHWLAATDAQMSLFRRRRREARNRQCAKETVERRRLAYERNRAAMVVVARELEFTQNMLRALCAPGRPAAHRACAIEVIDGAMRRSYFSLLPLGHQLD